MGADHVIGMEAPGAPIQVIDTNPIITPSPIAIFHQSLRQTEPVYARLMELKEKVGQYLKKWTVAGEADLHQRDGRIQKETITSDIKDKKPTLPREKMRPNSIK